MSMEIIHLRKLLAIFFASPAKRTSILRADIRNEIRKQQGDDDGGGDFHSPFWTDAKNHVAGRVDLREQTKLRIASNPGRARLYPRLADGFLNWWDERRRWRNEPFEFIPQSVKARLIIPELGATVKVENLLALKVGDQINRIIYPYFSEIPALPANGGRLGLWLLNEALTRYELDDMRILDILRSASYATVDHPLRGDERDSFLRHYERVLAEWRELWKEYP